MRVWLREWYSDSDRTLTSPAGVSKECYQKKNSGFNLTQDSTTPAGYLQQLTPISLLTEEYIPEFFGALINGKNPESTPESTFGVKSAIHFGLIKEYIQSENSLLSH